MSDSKIGKELGTLKEPAKIYRSEKSKLLLIVMVMAVVGTIWLFTSYRVWFGVGMSSILGWITIDAFLRTHYKISGDLLIIKAGFFYSQEIEIDSIYEIKQVASFSGAPAFSEKRLRLAYGTGIGSVEISPENRAEFVEELLNCNPAIQITSKLRTRKV